MKRRFSLGFLALLPLMFGYLWGLACGGNHNVGANGGEEHEEATYLPYQLTLDDPGHIHAYAEKTLVFRVGEAEEPEGAKTAWLFRLPFGLPDLGPAVAYAGAGHDDDEDEGGHDDGEDGHDGEGGEDGEHMEMPMAGHMAMLDYMKAGSDSRRQASVEDGKIVDQGDGTYAWHTSFSEPGAYVLTFWFEYNGLRYFNSFPIEISKAGGERIFRPEGCESADPANCQNSYQVRWELSPGHAHAGDEVTAKIELKRSFGAVDTSQPWKNLFDHLTQNDIVGGLPTIRLVDEMGMAVADLAPTYKGLGIYEATFTAPEVEEKTGFMLQTTFTDGAGFSVDETGEDYEFHVSPEH